MCIESMQNRLRFHQSPQVYSTSALSSWLRWIFFFSFFILSPALVWKTPLAKNEVKLSIAAHLRQIRKQKLEAGLWNMRAFRAILLLLEGCPLFWKGFSSKQTLVTLPILLPIKIYWKHPGYTAQLISSQLACQKQANIAITRIKRILPLPFRVHNQHLIRCNDLQYDKSGKIYCDRLNGTQHKYNYSSHDLLHLPSPKKVPVPHKEDTGCTHWVYLFFWNCSSTSIEWIKNKTKPQRIIELSVPGVERSRLKSLIYMWRCGEQCFMNWCSPHTLTVKENQTATTAAKRWRRHFQGGCFNPLT